MLSNCPQVLSWQNSTAVHSSILTSHSCFLNERLQRAVAAFVNAGVGHRLSKLLDELSAHGLDRLVTAPDSAWRLVHGRETDFLFFMNSVQAEHCRIGGDAPQRGIWTALGDHYFPVGKSSSPISLSSSSLQWDSQCEFRAPSLSNGIVIDYTSNHAHRFLHLAKLPRNSIQSPTLPRIVAKLEDARALIERISPCAHELISKNAQSILVWNDVRQNGEHFSLSHPGWPGRLGFSNVGYDRTDIIALADSMIHESIHAFLHRIEEITPLLDPYVRSHNVIVPSPWTGRALHIHSFLHACYVWFGLWQFWLRAIALDWTASDVRIQQMIDRSRAGFSSPLMDDALAAVSPHLSTEGKVVLAFVRDIQDGVYH